MSNSIIVSKSIIECPVVFMLVFIVSTAGDDFSAIDRVFEVPSEGNEFMINVSVPVDEVHRCVKSVLSV